MPPAWQSHCMATNAVSYRGYRTIASVLVCRGESGSLHAKAIRSIVGFALQWPSQGWSEVGLPTPSVAMRFRPPLPPTKLTSSLRVVWIDAIDLTASRHRSCLRVMPFGKPKAHHSTRQSNVVSYRGYHTIATALSCMREDGSLHANAIRFIVGFVLQWPSRG